MRPRIPAKNVIDGGDGDAEFSRECYYSCSFSVPSPYLWHVTFMDFRDSLLRTARDFFRVTPKHMLSALVHTTFTRGVAQIVELSSEKHVTRINTKSVVAMMTNKQSDGDGSDDYLPGESMRENWAPVSRIELPISSTMVPSGPQPTSVSFTDLHPETRLYHRRFWHMECFV